MAKSVVVLGKGDLAIRVAEWFLASPAYELTAIVPVIPEPKWTASLLAWGRSKQIRVIESGHYNELGGSAIDCIADLGFSVFYDKIFKAEGIARFGRLLNLHNGPLPKYRGMSPINWALKNGESSHGTTIHEITPGIDDGPIIGQVNYSIFPELDEVEDVYDRALKFGWVLFEEIMPLLDRIVPVQQDSSQATYYSAKEGHLLGDRRDWRRLANVDEAE